MSLKSRTESFIAKCLPAAETLPPQLKTKRPKTVAVLSNFTPTAIKRVTRNISVVIYEEKARGDFQGLSEYIYRSFNVC